MVNSIKKKQTETVVNKINAQNKKLRDNLAELFPDIPIFMNVLSEDELPDNMTYIVIETDNYSKLDTSKTASETVGITLWSMNRPDNTLDHQYILLAGQDANLKLQNTNNDFIVMSKTNEIINMFVATFHRPVLVMGC